MDQLAGITSGPSTITSSAAWKRHARPKAQTGKHPDGDCFKGTGHVRLAVETLEQVANLAR